jgi:hypothetical protein
MKKQLRSTMGFLAAMFVATCALGHWEPEDGHKMHFPQLPDPNGWDVDFTTNWIADDWMCSATGPVRDIHFWLSWRGDMQSPLSGFLVEIYDDVPLGPENPLPYSHPGVLLWDRSFDATQFQLAEPELGDQGWFDPLEPLVIENDHQQYIQVNITEIADPFPQEEGNTYWLALHAVPEAGETWAGWKTSQDHWNDNAVIRSGADQWEPLWDPIIPEQPLDMAFVITPEPGTAALLVLGAIALLRRRRTV